MSYDDWKTDPEHGMSHRDLHEAELVAECETLRDELEITQKREEKALEREIEVLERLEKLRDEIKEVVDWARDKQDVVDGDDGQPQPDDIMKIANMLEEALYGPGGY